MGLYRSGGVYCTQCEAEGFRRITYFLDRPDVLSVYTIRIEANQAEAPLLLSNGNLVERGTLRPFNAAAARSRSSLDSYVSGTVPTLEFQRGYDAADDRAWEQAAGLGADLVGEAGDD